MKNYNIFVIDSTGAQVSRSVRCRDYREAQREADALAVRRGGWVLRIRERRAPWLLYASFALYACMGVATLVAICL
jgi:hypothetical protein